VLLWLVLLNDFLLGCFDLSLWVCKRIISDHLGELYYLPSTPEQCGSVFYFELPLYVADMLHEPFYPLISPRSNMYADPAPEMSYFLGESPHLSEIISASLASSSEKNPSYAALVNQEPTMELMDVSCTEHNATAESKFCCGFIL